MSDRARRDAEHEARSDLAKPYEQLLADVHEELLAARPPYENITHAQKRLASLLARSALSAEHSSAVLVRLTWAILALTVVLVVLTVVMLWPEIMRS